MSFRCGSWLVAVGCALVLEASCSANKRDFGTGGEGGGTSGGEAGASGRGGTGGAGEGGTGIAGENAGAGNASTCAGGCGPESALTVVSISPKDGATDVPRNTPIVIKFSAPVSAASLTAASVAVTVQSLAVNGTLSSAGASATFVPTLPLPTAADVTVSVGTTVRAQAGGALSAAATATFSTVDGAWGTPGTVADATGGNVASIKVYPLQQGAALAVWARMASATAIGSLWSSTFDATKGWSAAKQIDSKDGNLSSYNSAAFALDHNGNAVVGWEQNKKVRVAHYKAGAGWQAPIDLGSDNLGDAIFGGIAFDAAGDAFATWTQSSATFVDVWGARYDVKKGWAGQAILDTSNDKVDSPSVAVSTTGRALVVWKQNGKAWSDYYAAGWQGAQKVDIDGTAGTLLSGGSPAFVSPDDALVLWRVFLGSGTPQVWNALYSGGTGWQTAAPIPVPMPNTLDIAYPVIAGRETGVALGLWTDDSESLEWGSSYAKAGGWKTAGQLATGATSAYASVVVDPAGNGIGAWMEGGSVTARRYLGGLGWSSAHPFAPSSPSTTTYPVLGGDDSGTTWIAWTYQGKGWATAFQ